jgi:hypothetical protein
MDETMWKTIWYLEPAPIVTSWAPTRGWHTDDSDRTIE